MSQTNGLGEGEFLDYDLFRRSTRVTDPRGGVRQYDYDENGRMTKQGVSHRRQPRGPSQQAGQGLGSRAH
ncbi:RHS repeat domain-containing protein [Thauera sinica]